MRMCNLLLSKKVDKGARSTVRLRRRPPTPHAPKPPHVPWQTNHHSLPGVCIALSSLRPRACACVCRHQVGKPPLHGAVEKGHFGTVAKLVDYGALLCAINIQKRGKRRRFR